MVNPTTRHVKSIYQGLPGNMPDRLQPHYQLTLNQSNPQHRSDAASTILHWIHPPYTIYLVKAYYVKSYPLSSSHLSSPVSITLFIYIYDVCGTDTISCHPVQQQRVFFIATGATINLSKRDAYLTRVWASMSFMADPESRVDMTRLLLENVLQYIFIHLFSHRQDMI